MRSDSRERSKNVSTTVYMHIKPTTNYEDRGNCENAFPEVLAKYKKMLEKIANQMIPDQIRTKAKQRTTLLKKEDAQNLHQQFDHIKRIRSDKGEATQWKSIDQHHEQLVRLARIEADGDRFKQNLNEMSGIIEDMLEQIAAMGSYIYILHMTAKL